MDVLVHMLFRSIALATKISKDVWTSKVWELVAKRNKTNLLPPGEPPDGRFASPDAKGKSFCSKMHNHGSGALLDYGIAFKTRYEAADEQVGLGINDVGKPQNKILY